MTATERAERFFVRELLDVIDGLFVNGHIQHCGHGIWRSPYLPPNYPNGQPCSKRCQAAQDAVRRARQWLEVA